MNPRGGWDGFSSKPKKPPPAQGIKIKKAGTTWWGQRWISALEVVLRGDAGRLSRGRTYARAGRTHDLTIENGKVSAKVTGSAAKPYTITIRLDPLSDGAWTDAITAMAERAQFSAELLAPRSQGAVLRQLGTPATWHEKSLPADLLGPLIAAAASRAREIALRDPEPSSTKADESADSKVEARPRTRERKKPDEPKPVTRRARSPAKRRPSSRD
ncbi:MAG: hypothetical protein RLZZ450_3219 [Pseudomonadota bacterium]|jgi:hypothetical protein